MAWRSRLSTRLAVGPAAQDGYLRVSVDNKQLRIAYHQSGVRSLLQSRYDLVTVELADHALVAN